MRDKNDNRFEVILAGSGGQGLVTSGIMLGEAAILENRNVLQTATYDPAQRGGFSMAEVIISDGEILFQHVQDPDIVLALTDESMNAHLPLAERGVPIIYDATLVQKREGDNLYGYPLTEMANALGHAGVANVIALGAMIAKSGMINAESMEQVLRKRFSGMTAEMNVKALREGILLAS